MMNTDFDIDRSIQRSLEFLKSDEGFSMNPISSYALANQPNPIPLPTDKGSHKHMDEEKSEKQDNQTKELNEDSLDLENMDLLGDVIASEKIAYVDGEEYHEPGYNATKLRRNIQNSNNNNKISSENTKQPDTKKNKDSYTIEEAKANRISRPISATDNKRMSQTERSTNNSKPSSKNGKRLADMPLSYPSRSNSRGAAIAASKKTQAKLEELREALRAKELEECSFAPRISEHSRILSARRRPASAGGYGSTIIEPNEKGVVSKIPYSEAIKTCIRLYNEKKKTDECQKKAETIAGRSTYTDCSFTPAINTNSRNIAKKITDDIPLDQRTNKIIEEHKENLAKLQALIDKQNSITFNPKISKISKLIVGESTEDQIAQSRKLIELGILNKEKINEKRNELIQREMRECTFAPKICKNSEKIAESITKDDFLTRQEKYKSKREYELQKIQKAASQETTFHPKIDEMSIALLQQKEEMKQAENKYNIIDENGYNENSSQEKNVYEKLYSSGKSSKKLKIESDTYAECTFRPKINELSSYIARPSTIEELTNDQRTKQNRTMLQRELDEQFKKIYTFEPQISERAKSAKSHYAGNETELMKQIKEQRMEKDERLQQRRKVEEYNELKACSFKPLINGSVPLTTYTGPSLCLSQNGITQSMDSSTLSRSSSTSEIKGIARFMELQQKARQLQQEQKMREQKVFGLAAGGKLNRSYAEGRPYTIPQPFNLSSSMNITAQQSATNDNVEKTFKPQTNAAAMRLLVSNILKSD